MTKKATETIQMISGLNIVKATLKCGKTKFTPKRCVMMLLTIFTGISEKKSLPENLTELDKEILDNCISCGTWDRASDVSPQFYGQVKRAVRSIAKKFDKLGINISYLDI